MREVRSRHRSVVIADPGPGGFLDIPVDWRGGMTLHQLRLSDR